MSVKIRLKRMGNTNNPFYRVIATDTRKSSKGPALETLGWYNPKKAGTNFELKSERINHWLHQGAIASATVKSLLKKASALPPSESGDALKEESVPPAVETTDEVKIEDASPITGNAAE